MSDLNQFQASLIGRGVALQTPAADGSPGQAIVTDGAGNLSFAAAGVTDHGALTGLSDDDHSIYPLLAGRSGGQTLTGGTGSGENLTLESTSHGTKGSIRFLSNALLPAAGSVAWAGRSLIRSPSDGMVYLRNAADGAYSDLTIKNLTVTGTTIGSGLLFPYAAEGNIANIFINGVAGLDIFNTRSAGSGDVRLASYNGSVILGTGGSATARVTVTNAGQAQFSAGSGLSAPGIAFSGSTNTGFFYQGSNYFSAVANGIEAIRIQGGSVTLSPFLNYMGSRVAFRTPADGVLQIANALETDFGRLQFGGTTSSFPALKRSGANFECRNAADTGYCELAGSNLQAKTLLYSEGALRVDTIAGIGNAQVSSQRLTIDANTEAGYKLLVLKGATSHSVNLFEINSFSGSGGDWFSIGPSGVVAALGSITGSGVRSTSTGYIGVNSRLAIRAPSDGVATIANWNENDFSRLQFGGTTSSFPSLKRSSTELQVRLADDSADAPLSAAKINASAGVSAGPVTFAVLNATTATATLGVYRITDRANKLAYPDGTNWRFVGDDAIIS